jgi:hypothetical protein
MPHILIDEIAHHALISFFSMGRLSPGREITMGNSRDRALTSCARGALMPNRVQDNEEATQRCQGAEAQSLCKRGTLGASVPLCLCVCSWFCTTMCHLQADWPLDNALIVGIVLIELR